MLETGRQVLRYLKGTKDLRLKYTGEGQSVLEAHVDASLASDIEDRKSTTGYLFDLFFWRSDHMADKKAKFGRYWFGRRGDHRRLGRVERH